MNIDLSVVLINLGGLFLLLAVGFFAVKLKIVPVSASGAFSALILKIALPCIIITAMQQPFSAAFLIDSVLIIGTNFLLFGLNLALAVLLCRLFRLPDASRGTWCLLVAFCNNGFMGFPVIFSLFGSEGLALASMINVPVCLIMYSSVPYLMRRKDSGKTFKAPSMRSVLLTPINVAILIGLLTFLMPASIPQVIANPVSMIGNTTTPLSMFVTGMLLSNVDLKTIFRDSLVWTATLCRLLLLPLLSLVILWLLPLANPLITSVTLITQVMPAAAVVTSLAETYDGDRDLAAKTIFLTSLLCILTIPFFAMTL